ncbi:MAG: hypothetical protein KF819_05765 [Labilithrix sp.]|nr:hypothetical protein [Labilithrix sp.]
MSRLGALSLTCALVAVGCTTETRTFVSGSSEALPPPGDVTCGPGSMSSLDGSSCRPVGTTEIPEGFEAAPEGWGFRAIRPSKACAGATRATLGDTSCVPIDDCDAPFPPPGATKVVRPGDVESLEEAIQYAAENSVIAIDRGTYAYAATKGMITRPGVRVVGRCAKDTIIKGTGSNAAFGLPRGKLTLEGLTLRDFTIAVVASGPTADVEIEHVLFEGNGLAVDTSARAHASIFQSAVDPGGRLAVSRDPIRGVVAKGGSKIDVAEGDFRDLDRAFTSMETGSEVTVKRSIAASRAITDSIMVLSGINGAMTIEESAVVTERCALLNVGQSRRYNKNTTDDASLVIRRSEINHAGPYVEASMMGVLGGARLEIEGSTLRHTAAQGMTVFEERSSATLRSSVIAPHATARKGMHAITALLGARVTLEGSAVVAPQGIGIAAVEPGTILSLDQSLVAGTLVGPSGGATRAFAVVVMKDAIAKLHDSVLADNEQQGLVVAHAATVDAERLVVERTRMSRDGALGDGILLIDEGRLVMTGSSMRRNDSHALIVMRAGGFIESSRFDLNGAGINVWESQLRREGNGENLGARELLLLGNTFHATGAEVTEGEIDVVLPAAAIEPP